MERSSFAAGLALAFLVASLAACAADAGVTGDEPLDAQVSSGSSELASRGPPRILPPGVAPKLPLRTHGRFVVDGGDRRVKLVSASWYGAESPDLVPAGLDRAKVADIAARVLAMGFDSVRLPWSNELVRKWRRHPSLRLAPTPSPAPDPNVEVVADVGLVAANPALATLHPLEIFDAVVDALTSAGVLVVLDNHTSRADWCCTETDGNGLWYRDDPVLAHRYTEAEWLEDWRFMARRYGANPRVLGAELRNELRPAFGVSPTWGDGDPLTDWHRAAKLAGDEVLAIAPHWLVFVGGLMWSQHFEGVARRPLHLAVHHRLVYAPHDYAFFHPGVTDARTYDAAIEARWGFLVAKHPIWVSEFGVGDPATPWFGWALARFAQDDLDFAYWSLNGTQVSEQPATRRATPPPGRRTRGGPEGYGLLALDWSVPTAGRKKTVRDELMALRASTKGPR